ncbi:cell division protein FtsQ/DivIB [Endothiovibrio diazotrophicus]
MASPRRGATPKRPPRPKREWQAPALPPRPAWLNFGNLIGLAAIGLFVWGTVAGGRWLVEPTTLPVKKVRVEGDFRHLAAGELERAVDPFLPAGFFSLDVEAVQRAAETLPWVAGASVRRLWPDTVRIRVEEHQPLAQWGDDQVVSRRGVRFKPARVPPGLPRLDGQPGLERRMAERLGVMGAALRPLGVDIRQLTVDRRRAWRVALDNGVELMLGRREVEHRLRRFVQFYPGVLAAKAETIRTVDMRYPNGFAVGWKPQAGGGDHPTQRG